MLVVQVIAALVDDTVLTEGVESVSFGFPLEPASPIHPALKLEINNTAKNPNEFN